ncbi:MAG: hypothetical protein RL549_1471 [Verrucomicrobiota bacterium]|jgi:hypothetical protein
MSTLSHAATLELVFNESSFSTTTTGTFRLTGEIPAMGYGSGGSSIGGTYYNDYHSFSSQYSLSFTAPASASFDFYLSAYPSTGTAIRDLIPYPIQGDYGISMNLFGGLGLATLQIYLQDQPDPGFGPSGYYPDNTLGMFMVDISGNFVASSSANGAAPASQGITFGNMEGTHQNQGYYTSDKFLTISVPEPSTLALLCLATIPILFRCRKIF